MKKWMSIFSMALFSLLFVPLYAFAEEGAEEAVAEPSGLFLGFLTVLGFATILTMIYLCVRDNG